MAPLSSPQDLGLGAILARALSSPTLSPPPTLVARQNTETVTVTASGDDGNSAQTLSGGAIAGIVIGSIAGFLLLLWVVRSCLNLGAPPQEREKWYHYKEEPRRHSHHHRSRKTRDLEAIAVADRLDIMELIAAHDITYKPYTTNTTMSVCGRQPSL
ncbi:hypothetical protein FPCIR_2123 [Fusarium pseudocircinatum]|uniref:Uncharacterized protein n=1 Tax=Fusarium pseudocircinatum TaxID=56676 RepID=A0A8H5PSZ6_9HYPO|nr:hypothetical protein FPCIR_2123 [Fusarium pseudocircinatum]